MLTELTAAVARPSGPVRLCAPESVCAYRLAPVLPEVRKRFPDVRLSLFPAGTPAALTALADRRAGLALVLVLEPALNAAGVDPVDLGAQQLSLVAPATTGLPRHRPITPAELAATGVLLLEEGCAYSDELAALIASADPATTPPRFGGIETVKRCVAAGLGLALLPTITVADDLADGRLVEPSSRWRSPAVRAVHAILSETAPASPPWPNAME